MIFLAAVLLAAAPAAAPPSVDAIVAEYVAARGGLERIRAVRSLRQTGHAKTDGGREAIVVRELQRPDKGRFEFTVQGITAVYVASGGKGWQVVPFEGDFGVVPMSDDAVADATEQAEIEGPLVDWKAKGHSLRLAGREKVGGREAYKLELKLKNGAVRHDYIDVSTHRHLRTDTTRSVNGLPIRTEATFDGHRLQDGVLFPTLVEVATAGRPQRLRIVVDTIEVNPTLAPSRFQRSAAK